VEARDAALRNAFDRVPAWLLGLAPLALIVAAIGLFAALGAPGLGERTGPPAEELAVERTVLHPGAIELTVRNDGPDPVEVAQIAVNDGYAAFTASDGTTIGRLGSSTFRIAYPWLEGEAYTVSLLTSAGGTIEHEIPVASETPAADAEFFGLMALLGIYVGVIPVSLGMLWLPFMRRIGAEWVRILIAFTVGLLAFLAVDAGLEGLDIAAAAPTAFGGAALVFLGAFAAYLALTGVEAWLTVRSERARLTGGPGAYLALMVAIGIGLHNLGEGLAIGSSFAIGELALGSFLILGFMVHNVTEGLGIAAPMAEGTKVSFRRLATLALVAGGPAILGAWIGGFMVNDVLAVLFFAVAVGAAMQVVVEVTRYVAKRTPGGLTGGHVVGGFLAGVVVMYLTGLLVG
jgi:ZIP family zinc transporter